MNRLKKSTSPSKQKTYKKTKLHKLPKSSKSSKSPKLSKLSKTPKSLKLPKIAVTLYPEDLEFIANGRPILTVQDLINISYNVGKTAWKAYQAPKKGINGVSLITADKYSNIIGINLLDALIAEGRDAILYHTENGKIIVNHELMKKAVNYLEKDLEKRFSSFAQFSVTIASGKNGFQENVNPHMKKEEHALVDLKKNYDKTLATLLSHSKYAYNIAKSLIKDKANSFDDRIQSISNYLQQNKSQLTYSDFDAMTKAINHSISRYATKNTELRSFFTSVQDVVDSVKNDNVETNHGSDVANSRSNGLTNSGSNDIEDYKSNGIADGIAALDYQLHSSKDYHIAKIIASAIDESALFNYKMQLQNEGKMNSETSLFFKEIEYISELKLFAQAGNKLERILYAFLDGNENYVKQNIAKMDSAEIMKLKESINYSNLTDQSKKRLDDFFVTHS